jgi:hypothetical protein
VITLLCVLLTAILFFYIFYMEEEIPAGEEKTRLAYLYERKDVIYDNLRDLNFEYRSGKFPETDFQAMRSTLEDEAAHVLAEIEELENASGRAAEALTKSRKGARS